MSGIPLHLLYNSAIFTTLSIIRYDIYVGAVDMAQREINVKGISADSILDTTGYEKLSNTDCITAYGKEYVSSRGNIVAASSNWTDSQVIVQAVSNDIFQNRTCHNGWCLSTPNFNWMCSDADQFCDTHRILSDSNDWTIRLDNPRVTGNPLVEEPSGKYTDPSARCRRHIIPESHTTE